MPCANSCKGFRRTRGVVASQLVPIPFCSDRVLFGCSPSGPGVTAAQGKPSPATRPASIDAEQIGHHQRSPAYSAAPTPTCHSFIPPSTLLYTVPHGRHRDHNLCLGLRGNRETADSLQHRLPRRPQLRLRLLESGSRLISN